MRQRLRKIICIMMIVFCVLIARPIVVFADNGNVIVHITETGVCYHAAGCKHLRQSDYPVTLHYAVIDNGFNECDDCETPVYNGSEPLHPKMDKRDHYPESINNTVKSATGSSTTQRPAPVVTEDKKEDNTGSIVLIILGAIFGLPAISSLKDNICSLREWILEKKRKKEEFEYNKQKYYDLYANKDPIDLVDIPSGVFLKDGYPCKNDSDHRIFGEYTVYVARKSFKVFHLNSQCGGSKLVPVNYYDARSLRPCKRCVIGKAKLPQISWYENYIKILDIKKKYDIP